MAPAGAEQADCIGSPELALGVILKVDQGPRQSGVQVSVAARLRALQAPALALAGRAHPRPDALGGGDGLGTQVVLRRAPHVDHQVHAVKQGTAQPPSVAPQLWLPAGAAIVDSGVAAGAG